MIGGYSILYGDDIDGGEGYARGQEEMAGGGVAGQVDGTGLMTLL